MQTVNGGESREMMEHPDMFRRNGTYQGSIGTLELLPMELATAPRKDSLHMPEYKHSRQLTIVSDVRTWAYIPPNPSFKKTHVPQHSLLYCLQ